MKDAISQHDGRPRLDRQQGFLKALYRVLPHVYAGTVSQRQAAVELCISARSLKRYMEQHDRKAAKGVPATATGSHSSSTTLHLN